MAGHTFAFRVQSSLRELVELQPYDLNDLKGTRVRLMERALLPARPLCVTLARLRRAPPETNAPTLTSNMPQRSLTLAQTICGLVRASNRSGESTSSALLHPNC